MSEVRDGIVFDESLLVELHGPGSSQGAKGESLEIPFREYVERMIREEPHRADEIRKEFADVLAD